VHCDIKPQNVIVQPQEHNAILVDYGLSSLRPKHDTKALGYTAVFAAPEVIAGKPPLPAADFYSLGLTMLYTLGGNPITKEFPDAVPKPLADFYRAMIHYNPKERPDWSKGDLVKRLSDVRLEVFGRRHSEAGGG